jgi:hypothetical protein
VGVALLLLIGHHNPEKHRFPIATMTEEENTCIETSAYWVFVGELSVIVG